jgi:Rod binding domain-containing protein
VTEEFRYPLKNDMNQSMNFLPGLHSASSRAAVIDANVASLAENRLNRTAKEFEATFLSLLLKEMRQTLEPDGGLFPGDEGDVQGGMFDLFLSQHLADAGGLGLASVIEHSLHHSPRHVAESTRQRPATDD